MGSIKTVVVLFGLLAIFALVGTNDYTDLKQEEVEYCASVARYQQTHGRYGHPPYNGQDFCPLTDSDSLDYGLYTPADQSE